MPGVCIAVIRIMLHSDGTSLADETGTSEHMQLAVCNGDIVAQFIYNHRGMQGIFVKAM